MVVEPSNGQRPRSDSSDVQLEVLFVRRRGQSERVVLVSASFQTRDADPLSRLVVETRRFLHLQVCHVYRVAQKSKLLPKK